MIETPIANVARDAAEAGSAIISKYFADLSQADIVNKSVDGKTQGLVTAADVESESAIIKTIQSQFPDHQFMAEENYTQTRAAEHLWVIDPLDGTNNFAQGIPHFAISIAYYHHGVPNYGLILDVARGDQYECGAGQGAWHNDHRVSVNPHQQLDQTMIGVGFYYDRGEMMQATLRCIEALFSANIIGIRRFGTAALDLVQVGLGRFGGFFEYTLSPWDFAAGRLFVEESGGTVTTCHGDHVPLEKSSLLASNGHLHPTLLDIVSRYRPNH